MGSSQPLTGFRVLAQDRKKRGRKEGREEKEEGKGHPTFAKRLQPLLPRMFTRLHAVTFTFTVFLQPFK